MTAADAAEEDPGRVEEVPRHAVEEETGRVEEEPRHAIEGPVATVQRAVKRAAPAASEPAFDNEEIRDTPRLRKVRRLAQHLLLLAHADHTGA